MNIHDVILGGGSGITAVVFASVGEIGVVAAICLVALGAFAASVVYWLTRGE